MFIRNFRALHILVVLVILYVGSYFYLSRRGFAEAEAAHFSGFYFFSPQSGREWEARNFACVYFYWPLIKTDCLIGTGRQPGASPLWGL